MNLPDFKDDASLNRLRATMGNPPLRRVGEPAAWEPISLERILRTVGKLVDVNEITIQGGELFYRGHRVLLYLKEQKRFDDLPQMEYKYHIAHCRTLQNFMSRGIFDRYVASTRRDGRFKADLKYYESRENQAEPYDTDRDVLIDMNVCKNCLALLRDKHHDENTLWNYDDFTLEDFFARYGTQHTHRPRYTDETYPANDYTRDWDRTSFRVRAEAHWRCSACRADFSNDKHLLEVHHLDGNRGNNAKSNLSVLCHRCHVLEHKRLESESM